MKHKIAVTKRNNIFVEQNDNFIQVSDLDKLQFVGLTRMNINIKFSRFALGFEHELP